MNQQPHQRMGPSTDLRTENEILKFKLMLEQGASFHSAPGAGPADPEMENLFLKEVIAFEEQHRDAVLIRVGDKIGPLTDFPETDSIPEGRLKTELARLQDRFHQYNIHLATLSPNVNPKELYRFMTTEFLDLPMRHLDSPGIYCFVYDDFHPDPYFENEWIAMETCIRPIFKCAPPLSFLPDEGTICLNGHIAMDADDCRDRISRFHERHTDIVSLQCEALKTTIRDNQCVVHGRHETGLCADLECRIIRGQWKVEMERTPFGDWQVSAVMVEGIEL